MLSSVAIGTDRQTDIRSITFVPRKKERLDKMAFSAGCQQLAFGNTISLAFYPDSTDDRLPNPRKPALELHQNCSETVMAICI